MHGGANDHRAADAGLQRDRDRAHVRRCDECGEEADRHRRGHGVPGIDRDGRQLGSRTHDSLKWEGGTLVFEQGSYTGPAPETGEWREHREGWSLDADGRLRITIVTRGSGNCRRWSRCSTAEA
jgi:hypothetical protein